jgi:hypothetical protein
MTGFEAIEKEHKPRGVSVSKIRPTTPETDYADVPSAMIFDNVHGLNLRDIRVVWDTTEPPQDRHAIYAGRVEDLTIDGFAGSASGGKLGAIGLEKCRNAYVANARPDAGTAVFIGASGTPAQEIGLAGNDFKPGTTPVQEGATYVHLP